ncbi:MAG: DUF3833 family protein [Pseudomonadota bacterium]
MADFFEGRSEAWGFFENTMGVVKKAFTADITGTWKGDVFVLEEQFQYADGGTDERIWRLSYRDRGHFIGLCDDVVGEAAGQPIHNGCYFGYKFRLPVGKRIIMVTFSDLFQLMDDQTLLNRAKVSKFGVPLGRVTAGFRRLPASE